MSLRRDHAASFSALRLLLGAAILVGFSARADSVAQVQTAKQITRATVILLQPCEPDFEGGIDQNGCDAQQQNGNSDVKVDPGDILTFRIRFTPVPNGATRGLGGYITDYIPLNTEVVGARIVDGNGNTVPPHRGGLAQDGVGPRGTRNYPAPLQNGSISQTYADTGIFFSTDLRTARTPEDTFLTVDNGIAMTTATHVVSDGFDITLDTPTGAGQLDGLLGVAGNVHSHNVWDALQAAAWGSGKSVSVFDGAQLRTFNNGGTGNAPFGYGSGVSGDATFYPFEATPMATNGLQAASVVGYP